MTTLKDIAESLLAKQQQQFTADGNTVTVELRQLSKPSESPDFKMQNHTVTRWHWGTHEDWQRYFDGDHTAIQMGSYE